jgi:hypothetical protein
MITAEDKAYSELVAMRAPLWLLNFKLMEESPELDYEKRFDKIFEDVCKRTINNMSILLDGKEEI